MAYDEALAERIREMVAARAGVTERKMFGGIAWMLAGNMAVGLMKDGLMVRLGDKTGEALDEPHTSQPMMGERPMKGMVVVAPEGVGTDEQLGAWIGRGAAVARSLPPK